MCYSPSQAMGLAVQFDSFCIDMPDLPDGVQAKGRLFLPRQRGLRTPNAGNDREPMRWHERAPGKLQERERH